MRFGLLGFLLIFFAHPAFCQTTEIETVKQFVGTTETSWFEPGDTIKFDSYGRVDNSAVGGPAVVSCTLYVEILDGSEPVNGTGNTLIQAWLGENVLDDIGISYATPSDDCSDFYLGYTYMKNNVGEIVDEDYGVFMRIGVGPN